jgi:hypothetical protein
MAQVERMWCYAGECSTVVWNRLKIGKNKHNQKGDLCMEVIKINIDELKPFAKNPKKHPPEQLQMLKKSMQEFGWTNPILVAEDNMVVAGHARLQAATELGFTEVPIIKLDMPYEKAVAYVIADNRLAELADTDNILMSELLSDVIKLPDFDLDATGYTMDELDDLINADTPHTAIEDGFDNAPVSTEIKYGDIIKLGNHVLVCGDASTPGDIEKLHGGAEIDLLYWDPPYENVELWKCYPESNKALVFSDSKHIKDAMQLACEFEHIYEFVWDTVISWFVENRPICRHRSAFLCVNEQGYNSDAFVIHDGKQRKQSDRNTNLGEYTYSPLGDGNVRLTTVYQKSKATLSAEHGKPIEWIAPIIAGSGATNVVDPYGGSGSTLIACEQIGIPCYIMEIDPLKCQGIVDRYNAYKENI